MLVAMETPQTPAFIVVVVEVETSVRKRQNLLLDEQKLSRIQVLISVTVTQYSHTVRGEQ